VKQLVAFFPTNLKIRRRMMLRLLISGWFILRK